MLLTIVRKHREVVGTFGDLLIDGVYFSKTCELPWVDVNKNGFGDKEKSCIPAGDYDLVPHDSEKYGQVVAFVNPALRVFHFEPENPLPDTRSTCLIHAANWPRQLLGCASVGEKMQSIEPNGLGVTASKVTLGRLQQRLGNRKNLKARIEWAQGLAP